MNPWPGAYTVLTGKDGVSRKLKIFEAARNPRRTGRAGEVLRTGGRGILVGCGSGSLLLREVQMEGKRRMTAREFLPGRQISVGMVLGQ
jgi:methionyl-tRNA formyltransferase